MLSHKDYLETFRGSSAVEHPAVNRQVAGSNPARGANIDNMPQYVV